MAALRDVLLARDVAEDFEVMDTFKLA